MHEYYAKKAPKLRKAMNGLLKPISAELEKYSNKPFSDVFGEIWDHYEKNMLENFPYIGGDDVNADQIVLINKGSVECSGTHSELLNKSDLYNAMWQAHISEGGAA